MNILKQNLDALKARFPEALLTIINAEGNQKIRANTHETFSINFEDKLYPTFPYGKECPSKLIERWLSAFEKPKGTLYAVTGFGDGSHIEALLKSIDDDSCVFVAEPNPSLLAQLFSQHDYSKLLSNPSLIIGTGKVDQQMFKAMGHVSFTEVQQPLPCIFSPLYALDENYFNEFFSNLAQSFTQYLYNYRSQVRDSSYQQEQAIINFKTLINAPDIGITRNCFKGKSLILVAAGPSLDESIDFLKKAKERAVIVCVNSAYRKLANSGIYPHITIAADPRHYTDLGYTNCKTDDVTLICPFFVAPQVLPRFEGRIFTWVKDQTFVKVFKQRLGQAQPTELTELGTVSSCVVDLASQWGCPRVCLVGQDFAITDSGKNHTEDSFYSDFGNLITDKSKCRGMPGNTRETVQVENKLFVYLKTFEQLVEDFPCIDFVNTSRIGAKVKGIPYADYNAALDWLGPILADSPKAIFDQLQSNHRDQSKQNEQLLNAVTPTLRFAQSLFALTLEAALYHDSILAENRTPLPVNDSRVIQALAFADKVNNQIDRHPQDFQILFEGTGKTHLVEYDQRRKRTHHQEGHWEDLLRNREFFWAIAESARFTLSRMRFLANKFAA